MAQRSILNPSWTSWPRDSLSIHLGHLGPEYDHARHGPENHLGLLGPEIHLGHLGLETHLGHPAQRIIWGSKGAAVGAAPFSMEAYMQRTYK